MKKETMVRLVGKNIPTDAIQHTEKDTLFNIDGNDIGTGTLYITESNVLWLNSREEGVELDYKLITLHAISRDLTAFPHEHLLLHYEGKVPGVNEHQQGENDEEDEGMDCRQDEDDGSSLIEIRFSPQDKESLSRMFDAMSDCQVLHPDPDDDCVSEEDFEDAEEVEGGDGFFTGEEGFNHLSEEGQANLERFNQMLQMGQGDAAEILDRTSQITITNGHHSPESESNPEQSQFQDADGGDMDH